VRGFETIEEGVVEFVAAGLVVVVLVVGMTLSLFCRKAGKM